MPRKSPPLTVRCWVPDDSGGYRPMESLGPGELAAFRKRNTERMNAALQDHFRAHPEAFVQTVKAVEAYEAGLSMQAGA